ncbi:putative receptor protein kinase ZmPK1 [Malania oleifera]|uniref:putative receptor protein kinase ZmPK1 n=1 Tax=Malania oleifera TaxID=397392 RepID=UPI0025AE7BD1|nr:putative receptor protein kinase ZmPK1 [Malania oleifera]
MLKLQLRLISGAISPFKTPTKKAFGLLFFLLAAPAVAWALAGPRGMLSLSLGSSLSVEKESDFLVSSNGSFSSGFYKVGKNAFCYSIWFTNSANKTVAWMANRDKPVNGKRSKLTLHRNGNLVLTDADSLIVWSTNTVSVEYVEARLLETGNLVLINQAEEVIWESFDYPTETLLPTQPFNKNTTLVSMRGKSTYLSGFFNFKFDDNNVLNLIYDGPLVSSVYWPNSAFTVFVNGRTPYNSSRVATLNKQGRFSSSDNLRFDASNYGLGPKRRLTLDYDGILRLYSLDESTGLWEITWFPSGLDVCGVHGLCGAYGICSYNPLASCSCPYGFFRADSSDWSKGCTPWFNQTCNQVDLDFMELHYTDYFGYDMETYGAGVTFEACRNACLSDCKCKGFGYTLNGQGQCYPKMELLNGSQKPSIQITMHLKVPKGIISQAELSKVKTYTELNCSTADLVLTSDNTSVEKTNTNSYMKYLIGFVGSIAVIEMICIGLGWWYFFRNQVQEELGNMGYIVLAMGFKRFTFAELKKATRNFKQEIGKGGFGSVYRGVLENDRVVAVKRLEGILQGEREFWAEVSIIGKINHRNLVKMLGFCAEGVHKMLVYEYLENGSLDKILFSDSASSLGWEHRYNVALGAAKGLCYLHEECLEWVLHCDVKPQNILLDDRLEPKVADFGMSKLFKDIQEKGFSKVRGTRGYLAPEWMKNIQINAKADVYSYGIVLLELLTGRSSWGFQLERPHEHELNPLVQWVMQKMREEGLEEVIDPRVSQDYTNYSEMLGEMISVALLCIGDDRDARPSMSKIVELLIGIDVPRKDEVITN